MYKDIEETLNVLTGNLEERLKREKAIDDSGKAIDIAKFNKILDEKIQECYELLKITEKDGTVIDKYGANIINARIAWLEDMKKHGSINHASHIFDQEKEANEAGTVEHPSVFVSSIRKIIGKVRTKLSATSTKTHNR